MIRAAYISLVFTAVACALPAKALAPKCVQIEPLTVSPEPFRVNPRFCGAIGNACERIPVPC